jgi:hypothetical protein
VDPMPRLSSALVNVNGTKQFIISWQTVANLTYHLEYKNDLNGAWTSLGNSIIGTGASVSVTNSITAPHCFFRVGVQ